MLLQILADDSPKDTWIASIIGQFPHQTDLLTWSQQMSPGVAAFLIMAGIVYLLFGFQIFKGLVLLNAAVFGAYMGASIGATTGNSETSVVCGLIGAVVTAAVCWPTMKYAVALMGGAFGALLGASLWHTVDLDPQLVWAGAMVGLVGFGLLAFILFRGSVMMFTSLQGSFMLVFGILGMIYKYQDVAETVSKHLKVEPFLLPAAICIPTVLGLIFQQHHAPVASAGGGEKKK